MTQHISFDLETLGKGPQAMILSIGAVKFDPHTGELGDTFYRVVDIEAKGGGGVIDASTVAWWMRQSQGARDAIFGTGTERVALVQALIDFSEWLGFSDDLPEDQPYPDVYLWQRGDKDSCWLTSAYEGLGISTPYPYWAVGDQRTLCKWVPVPKTPVTETAHNALDDAVAQAIAMCAAFKQLSKLSL